MEKDLMEKIFYNPHVVMFFISLIIIILLVTIISAFWNPFAPNGIIVGEYIEGYHEGFGDFCGQYPNSGIRLRNASYNEEHFFPRNWFYFGNQYKGIDNMIEGERYKIWYHQESRQSDTTSGNMIHYWVIDNIQKG